MILKASQRAGCMQLAHHLLKTEDNEHVEIHEISGFVSDAYSGVSGHPFRQHPAT